MSWRWGAAIVSALLLLACHDRSTGPERELEQLSHLIRSLRMAPNRQKGEALAQLRQRSCQHHCPLRSLCLGAYEQHQAALLTISEGRQLARDPGAEELARSLLRKAEAELQLALEETRRCAATEAELSRTARP